MFTTESRGESTLGGLSDEAGGGEMDMEEVFGEMISFGLFGGASGLVYAGAGVAGVYGLVGTSVIMLACTWNR